MTNKVFFKEQIWELACDDERIAVDKETNIPCRCKTKSCVDCALECHEKAHYQTLDEWCNAEHVEPYSFEKDELVEVSNDGTAWSLRFFSHIDEKAINGKYRAFSWGLKSEVNGTTGWDYCRKYGTLGGLAEGEKIRKEAIKEFAEWLEDNYETENYIPSLVELFEKEQKGTKI